MKIFKNLYNHMSNNSPDSQTTTKPIDPAKINHLKSKFEQVNSASEYLEGQRDKITKKKENNSNKLKSSATKMLVGLAFFAILLMAGLAALPGVALSANVVGPAILFIMAGGVLAKTAIDGYKDFRDTPEKQANKEMADRITGKSAGIDLGEHSQAVAEMISSNPQSVSDIIDSLKNGDDKDKDKYEKLKSELKDSLGIRSNFNFEVNDSPNQKNDASSTNLNKLLNANYSNDHEDLPKALTILEKIKSSFDDHKAGSKPANDFKISQENYKAWDIQGNKAKQEKKTEKETLEKVENKLTSKLPYRGS